MIKITNLTKKFGNIVAVNGVSLEVQSNEIFGLIGPDGAGKTTLIRLLCGLIDPTNGDATIDEKSIKKYPEEIRLSVGYMPQKFSLYRDLTVIENLNFYADIYLVSRKERTKTIERLLGFSNLFPFKNRLAENLSGGMKQKLGLCCSLIHRPKLLILDEPTNGVDPLSRREFWNILEELKRQEVTIFISTSYMDEAEKCDHVGLMHSGEIVYKGKPGDIIKEYKGRVLEIVASDSRAAFKVLSSTNRVKGINMYGEAIHINLEEKAETKVIKNILEENNIKVTAVKEIPPDIEDAFIYLIESQKSSNSDGKCN